MLDPQIAIQLRGRGWDVESIQTEHRSLVGLDDHEVLSRSGTMTRVLVTDNARDFVALHQLWLGEGRSHAGLIIASSKRYPRAKKTLGLWIDGLDAYLREHSRDTMDNQCSWLPDHPGARR